MAELPGVDVDAMEPECAKREYEKYDEKIIDKPDTDGDESGETDRETLGFIDGKDDSDHGACFDKHETRTSVKHAGKYKVQHGDGKYINVDETVNTEVDAAIPPLILRETTREPAGQAPVAEMCALVKQLEGQRQALQQALQASRVQQSAVDAQQLVLDAQEAFLDARQLAMDAREAVLDSRQAALDARQAILDARQAVLDAREALLNAREAVLDAREAVLDAKHNRRSELK